MKNNKTRGPVALIAILAVSLSLAALAGFVAMDAPVGGEGSPSLFSVESGASARAIVASLARAGFVRSEAFAYFYVRAFGLELKAGSFMISPRMPTSTLLRRIDEGKQESRRVTIPEGLSLSEVARHLSSAGACDAADFATAAKDPELLKELGISGPSAEGFLFPDTYFIPYGLAPKAIVAMMVNTFFQKTAEIPNLPTDRVELEKKVILASIIEREYRVADEAPKIASVFRNRLKIGMGLQSCATVVYVITEIQGKPHPSRLTNQDLEIDSDYNTYKWAGLPPGPIASPGLTALSAACNPEDTSYLYFRLTDPQSGRHSFTHSLDEHVRARRSLDVKRAAAN
jgi:UPF0755 protein